MRQLLAPALLAVVIFLQPPTPAIAQDVRITPDKLGHAVTLGTQTVTILRDQDQSNRLTGEFAKTSRPCPPFCIQPATVANGVTTVGELELMEFLDAKVATGAGLLVDSRVPEWFSKGTIPGAVNIPFSTLEPSNPYRDQILQALGAVERGRNLDFSDAMELMLFCNGPWCEQSPRALRNLIAAGYPADKLHYYRGGMQLWLLLGLTVIEPQSQG